MTFSEVARPTQAVAYIWGNCGEEQGDEAEGGKGSNNICTSNPTGWLPTYTPALADYMAQFLAHIRQISGCRRRRAESALHFIEPFVAHPPQQVGRPALQFCLTANQPAAK